MPCRRRADLAPRCWLRWQATQLLSGISDGAVHECCVGLFSQALNVLASQPCTFQNYKYPLTLPSPTDPQRPTRLPPSLPAQVILSTGLSLLPGKCYSRLAWGPEGLIAAACGNVLHFLDSRTGVVVDRVDDAHDAAVSSLDRAWLPPDAAAS